MTEPYRDLHLRFHANSGWVESLTTDDHIALRRRPAAALPSNRVGPIAAEAQRLFGDVIGVLRELYDLGQNREPSLDELTSALRELLPWMSHDEMMRRLREVAEEVIV